MYKPKKLSAILLGYLTSAESAIINIMTSMGSVIRHILPSRHKNGTIQLS